MNHQTHDITKEQKQNKNGVVEQQAQGRNCGASSTTVQNKKKLNEITCVQDVKIQAMTIRTARNRKIMTNECKALRLG